jgi:Ca2+/Na+ antiporter
MDSIITSAGLIAGLVFIFLNIKASGTLIGSFFKNHYRSMMAASILFFLGWLTEFFPKFNLMDSEMAESWHHIFLLIAGLLFVLNSLYMPKEAAKLMTSEEEKK